MADSRDSAPADSGAAWAFLSLRLWLGLRALLSGLDKFAEKVTADEPLRDPSGAPDPSGALVEVQRKVYGFRHYHAVPAALKTRLLQEPLLPAFLLNPFLAGLGYALVLLGLMLLLGLGTRLSLVLMAVLYSLLMAGLLLLHQEDGVAWLGVHVGLVAFALLLARHNRFALARRC